MSRLWSRKLLHDSRQAASLWRVMFVPALRTMLAAYLMAGTRETDLGSSSIFFAFRPPFFASSSSRRFLRSSFSIQPPYFELLPSSMTSLTLLYAAVSRTGFVAVSSPRPSAVAPLRTPFMAVVSHVHAAPWPSARPVVFSASEVREPAASEAALYAERARFTDSLSENWCALDASALVDSFHSLEALNSFWSVSVKTCQGDLSP